MADLIKFKRSAVGATITSNPVPDEGEPVYDFEEGRLYIGDNTKDIGDLYGDSEYMLRWDKVTIDTNKLVDGAITTAKIAGGAVTTAKISDGQITTAKLANSAVTTAKIADANVTTAKLANKAVTLSKLDVNPSDYASNPTTIKDYIKCAAGDGVTATSADKLAAGVANSSETRPVWFPTSTANNRVVGKPYLCTQYAGATRVQLNGTWKTGSDATIYAPTGQPTSSSNNFFVQWKTTGAPGWQDVTSTSVKWKRSSYADTADNADAIKIGSSYYTASFSNGVLRFVQA